MKNIDAVKILKVTSKQGLQVITLWGYVKALLAADFLFPLKSIKCFSSEPPLSTSCRPFYSILFKVPYYFNNSVFVHKYFIDLKKKMWHVIYQNNP